MIPITDNLVLSVRSENKRLIEADRLATHSSRYEAIAYKFGISEWSARWICQGREHLDVGGFIEPNDHEGQATRAIDDASVEKIREDFQGNASIYELADRHAVSDVTIERILLGKTYRDVGGPTFNKDEIRSSLANKPLGWKPKTAQARLAKHTKPTVPSKPMNLIVAASSTPVNNDQRSLSVEESTLNTIDIYLMRTSYNSGSTIEYLALKYNLPQNSIVDVINGTIFSDKPGCIQDVV